MVDYIHLKGVGTKTNALLEGHSHEDIHEGGHDFLRDLGINHGPRREAILTEAERNVVAGPAAPAEPPAQPPAVPAGSAPPPIRMPPPARSPLGPIPADLDAEGEGKNKVIKFFGMVVTLVLIFLVSSFVLGPGWAVLIVGIVAFIFIFIYFLGKKKGKVDWAIFIILLIILVVGGLWVGNNIAKSTTGKGLWELGSEALFAIELGREETSPQRNTLAALFKGEWDLDQQKWESRQVQDSYVVPEDAGVVFEDIAPSQSNFFSDEILEVTGDVTIVSLFEDGQDIEITTPLEIDVEIQRCKSALSEGLIGRAFDEFSELFGGRIAMTDWCGKSWTCEIPGEDPVSDNKFEVDKAYNRFFACEHSGITTSENIIDLNAKVVWDYTTQAVSGKQVFVASPDALARIEDLRTHYNIPSTAFDPWSISDGTVNFGVGFDKKWEFLRAGSKYRLGVSVVNDGRGDVVEINDLEVSIPHDEDIIMISSDKEEIRNKADIGKESGQFVFDRIDEVNGTVPVKVFKLKGLPLNLKDGKEEIEPGFSNTYYLKLTINEDYLQGSNYQSFFTKAKISYDYEQGKRTRIKIKPEPF